MVGGRWSVVSGWSVGGGFVLRHLKKIFTDMADEEVNGMSLPWPEYEIHKGKKAR